MEGSRRVCSLGAVPRGDLAFCVPDFWLCIWLGAALEVCGRFVKCLICLSLAFANSIWKSMQEERQKAKAAILLPNV